MNNGIRSNIEKDVYDEVYQVTGFPKSTYFNDCLKDLLQKIKELSTQ